METAMHPAYAASSSPRAILQRDASILTAMRYIQCTYDRTADAEPIFNPEALGV